MNFVQSTYDVHICVLDCMAFFQSHSLFTNSFSLFMVWVWGINVKLIMGCKAWSTLLSKEHNVHNCHHLFLNHPPPIIVMDYSWSSSSFLQTLSSCRAILFTIYVSFSLWHPPPQIILKWHVKMYKVLDGCKLLKYIYLIIYFN